MGLLDNFNFAKKKEVEYIIPKFTNIDRVEEDIYSTLASFTDKTIPETIAKFFGNNLVFIIKRCDIIKNGLYKKLAYNNFITAFHILYKNGYAKNHAYYIQYLYHHIIHEVEGEAHLISGRLTELLLKLDNSYVNNLLPPTLSDADRVLIVNEYYYSIVACKGNANDVRRLNRILSLCYITDIQSIIDIYSIFFSNKLSGISHAIFYGDEEYKQNHYEEYSAIRTAYYEILNSVPSDIILRELNGVLISSNGQDGVKANIFSIPKGYTRIWKVISHELFKN